MACPRFRLRDLDRNGRIGAALLALGLLLVPLVAATVNHGRWLPQGDDALIEVRARDVGTGRTPLVGQPSTSGSYGEHADNVAHPGPIEFFALALPVRLFGPTTGFLLTTAAVAASSLLVGAWVVFRQAGPRAGCLAAALLALAAFTAGAAGVVEPISSNAGRFPLLASAILVWALLCGDVRLAPLAAACWSYAAQQHLSVLPASAVVAGMGLAGAGWWVLRGDPEEDLSRRGQLSWLVGGVVTGLVLWAPVLGQQVSGSPGNLSALRDYSGDSSRQDLGLGSAFGQVAHVLGPRPFLTWSGVRGWDLTAHVGALRTVATLALVVGVVAAGAWWARADRRLVAASMVFGGLVLAGLVTGANIPDSPEQGRLAFYHWAFALSFFELLVVVWFGARLAPVLLPRVVHGRRVTAAVIASVVVVAVALVPVVANRPSDRLQQPIAASTVRRFVGEIERSPALHRGRDPLLVVVDGDDRYVQLGDTVAARLIAAGVDARLPTSVSTGFAHHDHLLAPCRARRVLVLSLVLGAAEPVPGEAVAAVDGSPSLDRTTLRRLTDRAHGAHVEFGPDLQRALDRMPGDQGELIGATLAFRLGKAPLRVLLNRANLDLLIAHPIASPRLPVDDLRALRSSLPAGATSVVASRITAHLMGPDRFRRHRPDLTAACS